MGKLGKSGVVRQAHHRDSNEWISDFWGNFFSDFKLTGVGIWGRLRGKVGYYSTAIAPKAPMGQALTG